MGFLDSFFDAGLEIVHNSAKDICGRAVRANEVRASYDNEINNLYGKIIIVVLLIIFVIAFVICLWIARWRFCPSAQVFINSQNKKITCVPETYNYEEYAQKVLQQNETCRFWCRKIKQLDRCYITPKSGIANNLSSSAVKESDKNQVQVQSDQQNSFTTVPAQSSIKENERENGTSAQTSKIDTTFAKRNLSQNVGYVLFRLNKYVPTKKQNKNLDMISNKLKSLTNNNEIVLECHTIDSGSDVQNMKLCFKRANYVKKYLKLRGIKNNFTIDAKGLSLYKKLGYKNSSSYRRVNIILKAQ